MDQKDGLEALQYINPEWDDRELLRQFEVAKEGAKIHGIALVFKIGWCLEQMRQRGLIKVRRKA